MTRLASITLHSPRSAPRPWGLGLGFWVLSGLAVHRVLVVPAAELLHLDALAVVDARLHRDVVPTLAVLAGQSDLDPLVVRFRRHRSGSLVRVRLSVPGDRVRGYLRILVTRPAPTVRPPSRIANRKPSSIAIGLPNITVISVLSPGITISVPSGNTIVPVTSVVRK